MTVSICFTPCHHKYKQLPQIKNQKFTGIALPTAEKEEKQAFNCHIAENLVCVAA